MNQYTVIIAAGIGAIVLVVVVFGADIVKLLKDDDEILKYYKFKIDYFTVMPFQKATIPLIFMAASFGSA